MSYNQTYLHTHVNWFILDQNRTETQTHHFLDAAEVFMVDLQGFNQQLLLSGAPLNTCSTQDVNATSTCCISGFSQTLLLGSDQPTDRSGWGRSLVLITSSPPSADRENRLRLDQTEETNKIKTHQQTTSSHLNWKTFPSLFFLTIDNFLEVENIFVLFLMKFLSLWRIFTGFYSFFLCPWGEIQYCCILFFCSDFCSVLGLFVFSVWIFLHLYCFFSHFHWIYFCFESLGCILALFTLIFPSVCVSGLVYLFFPSCFLWFQLDYWWRFSNSMGPIRPLQIINPFQLMIVLILINSFWKLLYGHVLPGSLLCTVPAAAGRVLVGPGLLVPHWTGPSSAEPPLQQQNRNVFNSFPN